MYPLQQFGPVEVDVALPSDTEVHDRSRIEVQLPFTDPVGAMLTSTQTDYEPVVSAGQLGRG